MEPAETASAGVTVREATADDEALLFRWANDPATRRWSWNSAPISWSDHHAWFRSKLADSGCVLLVGEAGDAAVGQVRFDVAEGVARLSFSVAPEHRGHRLSGPMLRSALDSLDPLEVRRVVAEVRIDNAASRKVLRRVGFCDEQADDRMATMVTTLASPHL